MGQAASQGTGSVSVQGCKHACDAHAGQDLQGDGKSLMSRTLSAACYQSLKAVKVGTLGLGNWRQADQTIGREQRKGRVADLLQRQRRLYWRYRFAIALCPPVDGPQIEATQATHLQHLLRQANQTPAMQIKDPNADDHKCRVSVYNRVVQNTIVSNIGHSPMGTDDFTHQMYSWVPLAAYSGCISG